MSTNTDPLLVSHIKSTIHLHYSPRSTKLNYHSAMACKTIVPKSTITTKTRVAGRTAKKTITTQTIKKKKCRAKPGSKYSQCVSLMQTKRFPLLLVTIN
jgi:hypothetical protein